MFFKSVRGERCKAEDGKLLEQTEGSVHIPNTPYVFRVGAAGVSSGGTYQFSPPQHEGCVKTIWSFYCFAFGLMSATP